MAKNGNSRPAKSILLGFLGLALVYIVLSSFKGIYNNLHTTPAVQRGLYDPTIDLLVAVFSSVLLGFVVGYKLKSKR